MTDPVEKRVKQTLERGGVRYTVPERDKNDPATMDFYLPDFDVYIECCRWMTARKVRQCGDRENIIIVVGLDGAGAFCSLIALQHSPS